MKREIGRTQRITLQLSRRQRDDNGMRTVPDGTVSAVVVLEVDVDALLRQMSARAIRSKGGKTVLARGAIVARAVDKMRFPEGA